MGQSCCSVVLIVTGAGLEPSRVTESLAMEPTQTWLRGERRGFTRADGTMHLFTSTHEQSGWKCPVSPLLRDASLQEQFASWVSALRPLAGALKALRADGHAVELSCFATTSENLALPCALLRELGEWGIDVDITFSSPPSAGS